MKKYEHVPGEGEDAMDGLEEGLLAAAYADELARDVEGDEEDGQTGSGGGMVPRVPKPKGGRVASYGFGEIVRGESYRDAPDDEGQERVSMGVGSGRKGTGSRASPSAVGEDGVEVVGMVRRSSSNSGTE